MSERPATPSGIIAHLIRLPADNFRARLRRGLWVSAGANAAILLLSFVASQRPGAAPVAPPRPPALDLTFEALKPTPTPTKASPTPPPTRREAPKPVPTPQPTPRPVPVARTEKASTPKPQQKETVRIPPPVAQRPSTAVPAAPAPQASASLDSRAAVRANAPRAPAAAAPVAVDTQSLSASAPATRPNALASGFAGSVSASVERAEAAPTVAAAPAKPGTGRVSGDTVVLGPQGGSGGVRGGGAPGLAASGSAAAAPVSVAGPTLGGRQGPSLGARTLATDTTGPAVAAAGADGGRANAGLAAGAGTGSRGAATGSGAVGRSRVRAAGAGGVGIGSGTGRRGIGTAGDNGRGPGVRTAGPVGGGARGPVRGKLALAPLGGGMADAPGRGSAGGAQVADSTRGAPVFTVPTAISGGTNAAVGARGGSPGVAGGARGAPSLGGPMRIVYILDSSGSMRERDKIGQAKQAIRLALSSLGPRDRFNILHFDNQVYGLTNRLVPATPENLAVAMEFVDQIRVRPNTNMSSALAAALSMEGVATIYLMSDGEPHGGIDDPEALREMVRRLNPSRAVIHTLALGLGEQFRGMELLREIAQENGGRFAVVNLAR